VKTVIISQARMTSSRLPGKVLRNVLGKSLLEYQIERLRCVSSVDDIVIATTVNASDDPIVKLCEKLQVSTFRGSEHDVLARYYNAAMEHGADVVVRVTSDCPVIDPNVVEKVVQFYLAQMSDYDYVSNNLVRTYPRGMDTEIFPFRILREAFVEAIDQPEREHVTPFIYLQPRRYRLGNVAFEKDESHHRWTVDTPEDFELINKIIEALYPVKKNFKLEDMLELLESHPDWSNINAHIKQKALGE